VESHQRGVVGSRARARARSRSRSRSRSARPRYLVTLMPTAERRAVIRAHDAARAPYLELAYLRIIDFLLIGYLRLLQPPPSPLQFSSSHGFPALRPAGYPSSVPFGAPRPLTGHYTTATSGARTNSRSALRGSGMQPSAPAFARDRRRERDHTRMAHHRVPWV